MIPSLIHYGEATPCVQEVRGPGVFMAGGSSLLPGVAGVLRNLFPDCPVHCEDPFEAIARGACRYAGEDINLALVHDYCLSSWHRERKDYVLVPVVPKGTRYPTEQPDAGRRLLPRELIETASSRCRTSA